jgi:hypothetical protein
MTGRRFAQLLVASIALALLPGGGCANVIDLGDYSLCGPVGAGGCGGAGGSAGDDGGNDAPSTDAAP